MVNLTLVHKDHCGDSEMAAMLHAFAAIVEALGLDERECAAIAGVPPGRLPLRPGRPQLSAGYERRLRHVIDVGTALGLLIGDADQIAEWMRTPSESRGGSTPAGAIIADSAALGEIRAELIEECRRRFGPVAWCGR